MPYTHNIHPYPYPEGAILTSADPEPCGGHIVRDATGELWMRTSDYEGPCNWFARICDELDRPEWGSEPETWTRVAGNYGPVQVVSAADDDDVAYMRRWL